ncbi:hypothetical protein K432DRAFT_399228 [Lepidopterella palustris CBS 459.81]|uniref:Major facilitator superfamily (MFS) profile domain-containing protein n=1 Tax=Lepidopterella palustris CBS 459.81 TaxID=1314670 RepID=A0A8E2J7Z0_9PEZI|nr:hypothetical protein K432DRAFT_399228 [Lepidopterella palustris CBS 459.81]
MPLFDRFLGLLCLLFLEALLQNMLVGIALYPPSESSSIPSPPRFFSPAASLSPATTPSVRASHLFFANNYSFDSLQASLVFIPIGVGGLVATLTTGKAVDWNYARHARRLGFPVRKNKFTDHSEFPLELAGMQVSLPLLLLGSACIIAYGWTMQARVSLAGPIVLLFFVGYAVQRGFQVLNVLMVDLYAGQAATATAANNLARCLLGAASSAAIIPMSDAVGRGWAYTVLALVIRAIMHRPCCARGRERWFEKQRPNGS